MPKKLKKIDLIIPCYNEEATIEKAFALITQSIKKLKYHFRFIYIDDGSKDKTREEILKLATKHDNITYVFLSRNFGKEIAVTAGLDHTDCDACLVLDADLQDPPELIEIFLKEWEASDYNALYGQRLSREGESWLKKSTASIFYKLISLFSQVDLPKDTGDFWLLDKKAITEVQKLRENHRYMKGLFSWIGLKKKAIPYERNPRLAGTTKFNYIKLVNLSIEAFTGYSLVPLKLITIAGILISILAMLFAAYIFVTTLLFGVDTPGYASIIVMLSFLSGVQLLSIGILGEYIGRIFTESKNRSLYIIEESNTKID